MPNTSHFRGFSCLLMLTGLLTTSLPAIADASDAAAESIDPECGSPRTQAMAEDFRLIRSRSGHFQGADWRPEIDAFNGRKHQLMQALAKRIPEENLNAFCLEQLLGKADDKLKTMSSAGAALLARIEGRRTINVPDGELLVYDWRGRHDRLVFMTDGGHIRDSGWLLGYE